MKFANLHIFVFTQVMVSEPQLFGKSGHLFLPRSANSNLDIIVFELAELLQVLNSDRINLLVGIVLQVLNS